MVDRRVQRATCEESRRAYRAEVDVFEAVPVRVEHRGDVLQRCTILGLHHDVGAVQAHDERLEHGVGLPARDAVAPTSLERERGLHLVEHVDAWRYRDLDRVLGQDSLGERVQRGDGRAVEIGERVAATFGHDRVVTRTCELERAPYPIAQLGCRSFGERDGGDLTQRDVFVRDESYQPRDEGGRLAGPRAGLDEERVGEAGGGDAITSELIDRLRCAHAPPPTRVT